ncbi:MAG: hypothetical protein Q9162_003735 [Coniocarpon cinnabarinum]
MRCRWQRIVALLALVNYDTQLVAAATTSASTSKAANKQATCATGSVNWITHTLPQQCLRTAWSPHNTSVPNHELTSSTEDVTQTNLESSSTSTPTPTSSADDATSPFTTTGDAVLAETTFIDNQASPESRADNLASGSESSAVETEADSALQSANFLSFEQWKKQKLGDVAPSVGVVDRTGQKSGPGGERQRPGNTLDTLGEDSEIDLDFSGFGGGSQSSQRPLPDQRTSTGSDGEANIEVSSGPSGARSKDAGRTCKERFNYASFDCAANVLKTNPKCKSSSSVLVENKDSYMLNECSMDNKFLIVELCDHIQIDTVVLANFEFFSSMFRTFRVSVSDRYPVKLDKWKVLGTYEARNTREIQAFLVENPLIWAKYIRLEFLTHYGNEYYCPLSLLRVHGTTMMEDYRHQEELARGEIDASEDELEVTNEVVAVPAVSSNIGPPEAIITPLSPDEAKMVQPSPSGVEQQQDGSSHSSLPLESSSQFSSSKADAGTMATSSNSTESGKGASSSAFDEKSSQASPSALREPPDPDTGSTVENRARSQGDADVNSTSTQSRSEDESLTAQSDASLQARSHAIDSNASVTRSDTQNVSIETTAHQTPSNRPNEASPSNLSASATSSSSQTNLAGVLLSPNRTVSSNGSTTPTQQNVGAAPSATQPATQESFFKTLSKRLSLLEANATLSLQYIESQSMLLRDAFTAVEKRQIAKTASFLSSLNETVLKELAAARSDYDQLWQSTVLELASQREEGRRERETLNEQVRLLAEEVVGQRRLMAVQVTVVLVVLGLFLFTKAAPSQPGEASTGVGMGDIRILQTMQALMARGRSNKRVVRPASAGSVDENRSPSEPGPRWGWESPFMGSPGTTRPATSHGMDETHEDAWDDLLAFVDENVRPRKRTGSKADTPYLKQKPLPPAPRPDLSRRLSGEDGLTDHTNTSSPLDFTPSFAKIVDSEDTDSTLDEEPQTRASNQLNVPNNIGRIPIVRRSSSFRTAQSAPPTPGLDSHCAFANATGSGGAEGTPPSRNSPNPENGDDDI